MLQKIIAQKLFIDESTYSKYERGINEPNLDMLIKIAQFFSVATDYLLGIKD